LRNLFGGGRSLRLALVRDPGLTASVDLHASDPFVLGLPLRLDGRFEGYGKDSTFSRQRYRVEAGYRVASGLELTASGVREAVQPGSFGARPVPGDSSGRPRIAAADAAFAGFGVRYSRVDAPVAPRRGLVVAIAAERGRRRRTLPDSVAVDAAVTQQRLEAGIRAFVPTFRRQSLVVGLDARVILGGLDAAGGYDEGDLFRFGGASSLRGYDEDAFAGDAVGRVLGEYRYALDPESYAFVFMDVGFVGRPATPEGPASDDVKPGYGFGVQYRTPLGIATLTYALNPDLGAASGNVHVGLGFGL
jgi:outer membrane protein assembly factor BamA